MTSSVSSKRAIAFFVTTILVANASVAYGSDFSGIAYIFVLVPGGAIALAVPTMQVLVAATGRRWLWFLFPVVAIALGVFVFMAWALRVAFAGENLSSPTGQMTIVLDGIALPLSAITCAVLVRRTGNKRLWVLFPLIAGGWIPVIGIFAAIFHAAVGSP